MRYTEVSRLRHETPRAESEVHWIVVAKPSAALLAAAAVLTALRFTGNMPDLMRVSLGSMLGWMPPRSAPEQFPAAASAAIGNFPGAASVAGGHIPCADMLAVLGVSAAAASAVALIRALVRRLTTEYAVTSRRVAVKTGFVARSTYEIPLDRIEGAYVLQSFWGRLLGYGLVIVRGVGGGLAGFPAMSDPVAFRIAVADAIEDRQDELAARAARAAETARAEVAGVLPV